LIRNYIHFATYDHEGLEEARKEYPYPTLQSFFRWSEVMGDILACAGVPGFLSNIPNYLSNRQDESDTGTAVFFNQMWETYKGTRFTVEEALMTLQEIDPLTPGADGSNPHPKFGFAFRSNIRPDDTARKAGAVGMWLTKCVGRAYAADDGTGDIQQLVKVKRTKGRAGYELRRTTPAKKLTNPLNDPG
jgi:hypothetical protein